METKILLMYLWNCGYQVVAEEVIAVLVAENENLNQNRKLILHYEGKESDKVTCNWLRSKRLNWVGELMLCHLHSESLQLKWYIFWAVSCINSINALNKHRCIWNIFTIWTWNGLKFSLNGSYLLAEVLQFPLMLSLKFLDI